MSHPVNHVKWCINKAKKELDECKRLGKRLKHRGLVTIQVDIEDARKHISKAEHNLKAIQRFHEIGFSDWSISAGFYCTYHCFLAISLKFGYESRNQECTIALIEMLKEDGKINIDDRFINMLKYADIEEMHENTVIEMREDYTYGIEISVADDAKIKELIAQCKNIIDLTKKIVY